MLKRMLLAVAGGAALGIGCVTAAFPLPLIGLVPLLLAISGSSRTSAAALGYFFGIVYYGFALYAIFWESLPLSWTGIELTMSVQYGVTGVAWLFTAAILALAPAVWASLAAGHDRTTSDIVVLPSVWVILECAASIVLSFALAAPGIEIGPHIGIGHLGMLIADDIALLQFSQLGGIFALSFIVVVCNVALYRLATAPTRERKILAATAAACVLAWAGAHAYIGSRAAPPGDFVVTALRSDAPLRLPAASPSHRGHIEGITSLMREARGSDIILLPEGSAYFTSAYVPSDDELRTIVGTSTVIVDSSILERDGRMYRRLDYYDLDRGRSEFRYKHFLVPVGEYMPFAFRVIASLSGAGSALDAITSNRHFASGVAAAPVDVHDTAVAGLFCEELLSPTLYAGAARSGAEVFLNSSSLAWYRSSPTVYMQMLRAARVRAAESRRFLVAAGDASPAYALDWYGRIIAETAGGHDAIRVSVPAATGQTPYSALGLFVLLFPLIVVAIRYRASVITAVARRH